MIKQTQAHDIAVIRSNLLGSQNEILFGFSTRQGGFSDSPYDMNLSYKVGDDHENVCKNRKMFFSTLNINPDRLAIPNQVHGDTVQFVTDPGTFPSCDALMTNRPNIFLVITVADCLPIFLFDPTTKSLAAIHVGWRGSVSSILKKTIMGMQLKYDVRPENLIAYLGPSAGPCCYEVGHDVAKFFSRQYLIIKNNQKKNFHLDLKKYNIDLLRGVGVLKKNIEISSQCTICNPEVFHSYRRDWEKSGRMMGVIGRVI
ncbi:MAG TPA: peptidoglycan editing factor PgeF [Bacteroidota bacterium]|nr:peptidoglycan editing factor PgeF [Bacteroidota bacterium]